MARDAAKIANVARSTHDVYSPVKSNDGDPRLLGCGPSLRQAGRLADVLMTTVAIARRAQPPIKKNMARTCP